jgi:uncharacterized protein
MKINKNRFKISTNLEKIDCVDGEYILYHRRLGNPLKINPDTLEFLEEITTGLSLEESLGFSPGEEENQAVQLLIENKIIFPVNVEENAVVENILETQRDKLQEELREGNIISDLQLVISNLCNLSCTYCFCEKIKEISPERREQAKVPLMSEEIACKSIDNFLTYIYERGKREATIKFFGGEPLMNWPVLEASLDYITRTGWDKKIDISYIITTNGILLTDKMARKLKQYDFSVQVSLDGLEESHNATRKDHQGKGTFQQIDACLNKLEKAGACVVVASVIDHKTKDLYSTSFIDYLISRKVEVLDIAVEFLSEYSLDEKLCEAFARKIIELRQYGIKKEFPVTGYFGLPYRNLRNHKLSFCKAQGAFLSVEPSGDVFPCKRSGIKTGNIQSIPEIILHPDYESLVLRIPGRIKECTGCEIEAGCMGGCFASSEYFDHTIESPDKTMCGFLKKMTRKLFEMYEDENTFKASANLINRRIV